MSQTQPPVAPPPVAANGGQVRTKKAVGLAVAALILGITAFIPGLGFLLGLVGLILGIVALAMGTSRKGVAVTGLVLSIAGPFLSTVIYLAIALPIISRWGFAERAECAATMALVGNACSQYAWGGDGRFPPDLQTLVDEGLIPANVPSCSAVRGYRGCEYFYFRPKRGMLGDGRTMVACDLKDNHRGLGRNVLYLDGIVEWHSEAEFRGELARPVNAEFAAALRAAEGP